MSLGTVAGWNVPAHPTYLYTVPLFHCNGWGHAWTLAIVGGTASNKRGEATDDVVVEDIVDDVDDVDDDVVDDDDVVVDDDENYFSPLILFRDHFYIYLTNVVRVDDDHHLSRMIYFLLFLRSVIVIF